MSTDDLNKEVMHCLMTILASIVHNPVALGHILLPCNFCSDDKQVAKKGLILRCLLQVSH